MYVSHEKNLNKSFNETSGRISFSFQKNFIEYAKFWHTKKNKRMWYYVPVTQL